MRIGIDLGGSHIAAGLVNDSYKIIEKKEHEWIEKEKENFFENVLKYIKIFVQELINESHEKVEKIGIGFPAADIVDGIVTKYGKTVDLPQILSKEFNIPVYLKNDVKCSALCEKTIGNLKEYNNCLFMTLGTGIGGAYFYKNELVVPNKYPGFEVGHMIIELRGKQCRCGQKGCFEEYASMRVFRKQIEELFGIKGLTSHKMFQILETKENENEVHKIIDRYIENISIGICNLINIFEPDAICIGGSFSYYAPIFMDKLKEKVKEFFCNKVESNFKNKKIPEILVAKHENDAGIIGATMLEEN